MTLSEIQDFSGEEGDFQVTVIQHPRYVDLDKCIGCGQCAQKCPGKVSDTYNRGLSRKKAISIPYSQAVPLKYSIDAEACLYLQKGKCGVCEKICPTGAINFEDQARTVSLRAGSIILAPGFKEFDPGSSDLYSFGVNPDVVTSLQFERMLSATGPFAGELILPSGGKEKKHPKKIAWLQCVGSRDINRTDHSYCSSVCCMYAVKQAVIAREHSQTDLECAIFYMDMRSQGKGFDQYCDQAGRQGVRFVRSRPHTIEQDPDRGDILLRYVDEQGASVMEHFDLLVLSTGIELDQGNARLFQRLGLDLDPSGFASTSSFTPVAGSIPGVYVCGACSGPKDIPYSVMEASAAAAAASQKLAPARGTRVRTMEVPPEKDIKRQKPRIGVFVCRCGINIAGVVDCTGLAEYARTLKDVVYVEENLFTCSQDSQEKMSRVIAEQGVNRVVVAACTPRTHLGLFQETLVRAGLNGYLLEMANIRNHDSWVHADDPEGATQKAKDLVRIAWAKSRLLRPLQRSELPVKQAGLVVGGGVAGMTAALHLARQGFPVHLLERASVLGGNALKLNRTYKGEDIASFVRELMDRVAAEEGITVHLQANIQDVQGFVGNFRTTIREAEQEQVIDHGVAVLSPGAGEYKPDVYGYGQSDRVLTCQEMDGLIRDEQRDLKEAGCFVFIHCVGSRNDHRPYCSKVCCTHSLRNALDCKRINPDAEIYVLYRDIRTYGQREDLYRRARQAGIKFFRYRPEAGPEVRLEDEGLRVDFSDPILDRRVFVQADYICLATAVQAAENTDLARFFKVPLDGDGWFAEAHQKLRPVDFPNEGVFVCGLAHYPKPMEESIAQAQAAASRALTILSKTSIEIGGEVARVLTEFCSGCRGCEAVCPFQAITFEKQTGVAEINPALCKGCGACSSSCPAEAIVLEGCSNRQLYAQIENALAA
ncbi:MAG: FAD-dependent oxidoreductase [Desulfohalobiaceae bacterium]|nr:FAD-dependent oxidoreductase [Desulfohalobiaceae bacterium]